MKQKTNSAQTIYKKIMVKMGLPILSFILNHNESAWDIPTTEMEARVSVTIFLFEKASCGGMEGREICKKDFLKWR